jgi:hypothetical protein
MIPGEIITDGLRWYAQHEPRRAVDRAFAEIDARAARTARDAGDWPASARSLLLAIARCKGQPAALVRQLEEVRDGE